MSNITITQEKTAGGLPYTKVSVANGPFKSNATEPNLVVELKREMVSLERSHLRDKPVVINLSGAEEADSKGISTLIWLHKEIFKPAPAKWPICFILSQQMWTTLREFSLLPVILCFTDEEEFRNDYEKNAPI